MQPKKTKTLAKAEIINHELFATDEETNKKRKSFEKIMEKAPKKIVLTIEKKTKFKLKHEKNK